MSSRLVKFALVGGIGFVADALVFATLFYYFDSPLYVARAIAFIFAATTTWLGNRILTFADCAKSAKFRQWLQFMVSATLSAIPNFIVFSAASFLLGSEGLFAMVALVLGVLAGMVSNYLLSSKWVFKASS